ncbi:hypothetical protein [Streptomyces xanthochromogenes]|uniref:hypothetical protein n=1 Tax=Streptomyces xanthochromogenes TaxID=67384 RepID=UPI0038277691
MFEEVAALAMTGATTVVAAMATDGWSTARVRMAGLFRRADDVQRASLEGQLDGHAALVASSDDAEAVRQDLVPVWRLQLAALLRQHPDAAEELQLLVREIQEQLPSPQQGWQQRQTNIARDHGQVFASLGGSVIVHRGPERPPPAPSVVVDDEPEATE